MKKLLVIDEKDYNPSLPEIFRIAVRGIFKIDEKLVLIESSSGELKIPGGGMEDGETDEQTLIREVLEETGYVVKPESIKPFGEIEEKRLGKHEPMIWHQINRLYFCEVEAERKECNYSENEIRRGFRLVYYTVQEAVKHNEEYANANGSLLQNEREYQILKLIMEGVNQMPK